jgi:hypothetical protein
MDWMELAQSLAAAAGTVLVVAALTLGTAALLLNHHD